MSTSQCTHAQHWSTRYDIEALGADASKENSKARGIEKSAARIEAMVKKEVEESGIDKKDIVATLLSVLKLVIYFLGVVGILSRRHDVLLGWTAAGWLRWCRLNEWLCSPT